MPRFERICPECGASNSFDKTQCGKCRAPLTRRVDAQTPPPDFFSRKNMMRLAWRATKFLTRTGFNLARRGAERGIERVQHRKKEDVKNETIDAEYQISDWRVWGSKPAPNAPKERERLRWGKKP